jgi:hypothetical protein
MSMAEQNRRDALRTVIGWAAGTQPGAVGRDADPELSLHFAGNLHKNIRSGSGHHHPVLVYQTEITRYFVVVGKMGCLWKWVPSYFSATGKAARSWVQVSVRSLGSGFLGGVRKLVACLCLMCYFSQILVFCSDRWGAFRPASRPYPRSPEQSARL